MKKIKQIKTYEIKDLNIKDNNRNYNFIETDEGENQNVKFSQNSINDKLNRNFVAKRNFSFENESPNGNTKISNDSKIEGKLIINDERILLTIVDNGILIHRSDYSDLTKIIIITMESEVIHF